MKIEQERLRHDAIEEKRMRGKGIKPVAAEYFNGSLSFTRIKNTEINCYKHS